MSYKIAAFVCLALAMCPFIIGSMIVEMTWVGLAAVGGILVVLVGSYVIDGMDGVWVASIVIAASLALAGILYPIRLIIRRRFLIDGPLPRHVDLKRWCRRELRRAGWNLEPSPYGTFYDAVGRKPGHSKLVLSCLPELRALSNYQLSEFRKLTDSTRTTLTLALFVPPTPTMVAALADENIHAIAYRDLVAAAPKVPKYRDHRVRTKASAPAAALS